MFDGGIYNVIGPRTTLFAGFSKSALALTSSGNRLQFPNNGQNINVAASPLENLTPERPKTQPPPFPPPSLPSISLTSFLTHFSQPTICTQLKLKQHRKNVDSSIESERGSAQQIRCSAHEHQCRQGLARRSQDQSRPQRHHQDACWWIWGH
ncbi:hypothetical protein Vadar_016929 [Vaccinium darrowii]|uniref:Uncharacterized protein n=1 Tax=Vaccinium darrowii TaxID=229202 RepID=A0ACB7XZM0_9ERIC|nr:hypothetical protein Vadar_016929 [Vaccinium darrowii]